MSLQLLPNTDYLQEFFKLDKREREIVPVCERVRNSKREEEREGGREREKEREREIEKERKRESKK